LAEKRGKKGKYNPVSVVTIGGVRNEFLLMSKSQRGSTQDTGLQKKRRKSVQRRKRNQRNKIRKSSQMGSLTKGGVNNTGAKLNKPKK